MPDGAHCRKREPLRRRAAPVPAARTRNVVVRGTPCRDLQAPQCHRRSGPTTLPSQAAHRAGPGRTSPCRRMQGKSVRENPPGGTARGILLWPRGRVPGVVSHGNAEGPAVRQGPEDTSTCSKFYTHFRVSVKRQFSNTKKGDFEPPFSVTGSNALWQPYSLVFIRDRIIAGTAITNSRA